MKVVTEEIYNYKKERIQETFLIKKEKNFLTDLLLGILGQDSKSAQSLKRRGTKWMAQNT